MTGIKQSIVYALLNSICIIGYAQSSDVTIPFDLLQMVYEFNESGGDSEIAEFEISIKILQAGTSYQLSLSTISHGGNIAVRECEFSISSK